LAGYIPRRFTRSRTVTYPSTNRARRRVTTLIETNALPLSQATNQQTNVSFVSKACWCEQENGRSVELDGDDKADKKNNNNNNRFLSSSHDRHRYSQQKTQQVLCTTRNRRNLSHRRQTGRSIDIRMLVFDEICINQLRSACDPFQRNRSMPIGLKFNNRVSQFGGTSMIS